MTLVYAVRWIIHHTCMWSHWVFLEARQAIDDQPAPLARLPLRAAPS